MFRTSCKVVQRNNKKRKSSYPKSTNYFLNQSTFEWLWNHVWLWKKRKKHMYLSHCLHELLQFYRPQSRLGQSERWLCVFSFCFLFLKMLYPQRLLPNHRESSRREEGGGRPGVGGVSIFIGGVGCIWFWGPPPLPAGFGVTLWPGPPALWPVFRWDCDNGRGGVGGGRVAQFVLDVLIRRHC